MKKKLFLGVLVKLYLQSMLEKTLYLIAALLGFITVLLIGFRYNSKKHANIYLILGFLLSSFRFLIHGLQEIIPIIQLKRQIDVVFFMFFVPLIYLYFRKLIHNSVRANRRDLFHLIIPLVLTIFNYTVNLPEENAVLIFNVLTVSIFILNIIYIIAAYKLLRDNIWKRSSEILIIDQQNIIIKKWTQLLFFMFSLMMIRFCVSVAFFLNKSDLWYESKNNFAWIATIFWIILYVKTLISPEFLYGYDIFQKKINKYQKNAIVLDHIWIPKNKQVVNTQDIALKEKIEANIKNYIIDIEYVALNSDMFLIENYAIEDLSKRLNVPKSHVHYVFKYHAAVNFSEFKKIIRVQKALSMIDDGFLLNNTLESLATYTGFSSYSPFYKSFKLITGITPQDYFKNNF